MDLPSEAQWEKSVKGLSEDSDVTLGRKILGILESSKLFEDMMNGP